MSMLFAAAILVFIAAAATAVVLTRDPVSQCLLASFYGLLLAMMFFIFQAPDVSFSQLAVGTIALPCMILLALAKIKRQAHEKKR